MPLGRAVTVVGSRHRSHLHLLSKSVSKAHALIVNSGGRLYIRDLASRSHVIINGQPVNEHDLRTGDVVQIGSFLFKFEEPASSAPRPPAPPQAMLRITGRTEAMPFLGKTLLIGRRSTCDVALDQEAVSTTHAVIFEIAGQRFIRDLGSRTGTYVNGISIHQTPFNVGDRLKIGDVEMRCSSADAAPGVISLDDPDDGRLTISEPAGESGLAFEPIEPAPAPPQVEVPRRAEAPAEPKAPPPPAPPIQSFAPIALVAPAKLEATPPAEDLAPIALKVPAEPEATPAAEDFAPSALETPAEDLAPIALKAPAEPEATPAGEDLPPIALETPAVSDAATLTPQTEPPPGVEALAEPETAAPPEELPSATVEAPAEPEAATIPTEVDAAPAQEIETGMPPAAPPASATSEAASEHWPEMEAEDVLPAPAAETALELPPAFSVAAPVEQAEPETSAADAAPIPLADLPNEAPGEQGTPYPVGAPAPTLRELPAEPSDLDLEFLAEAERAPTAEAGAELDLALDPIPPVAGAVPIEQAEAGQESLAAPSPGEDAVSPAAEAHAPGLLEEATAEARPDEPLATGEADDLLDLELGDDVPPAQAPAAHAPAPAPSAIRELPRLDLTMEGPAAPAPADSSPDRPAAAFAQPATTAEHESVAPTQPKPKSPASAKDWAAELGLGPAAVEKPLDLDLGEREPSAARPMDADGALDLGDLEPIVGKSETQSFDDDLDLSGLVVDEPDADIDERHLSLDAPTEAERRHAPEASRGGAGGLADDLDLSLDLPPRENALGNIADLRLDDLPPAPAVSDASMPDLSLPEEVSAPRADDLFRGMSSDFGGLLGGMPPPPAAPPPTPAAPVAPAPKPAPAETEDFVLDEAGAALERFEARLAAAPSAEAPAPSEDNNDAYGDPTDGSLPLPPTELAPAPDEGISATMPGGLSEPTVQSAASAPLAPKPPPRARLTGKGRRAQREADAANVKAPGAADSFGAAAGWNNLMDDAPAGQPAQTTTSFDGLAMPLPPTDVFWQMPSAADPIFGRSPATPAPKGAVGDPLGAAVRAEPPVEEIDEAPTDEILADEPDQHALADAPEPEEFAVGPLGAKSAGGPQTLPPRRGPVSGARRPPSVAPPSLAPRSTEPARPTPAAADETFRAPARRRRLSVGVLLMLMLALMAAVGASLYLLGYRFHYFAPRADVIGSLPFQSLDTAAPAEKQKLIIRQREILKKSPVWERAREKMREMEPNMDWGFLAAGGEAGATAYTAIADSAEIPSGRSAVLLRYTGQDPAGDQVRFLALLKSMYALNRNLVEQSSRSEITYDKARAELAKVKGELENLQRERETLSEKLDVDPALRQRDVRRLRDEAEQLWKRWGEATAIVQATQVQLEQIEAAVPPPNQAGGPASPAPPADPQVAEMEQQIKDLSQSLAAKKESRLAQSEAARKSLDQALSAFDKEIASARSAMKGESELTRYLATAKRVQDTIRTAQEDLAYQQKEDYARLSELKRRLAEKNESRIKEAWADDSDLKAMGQDQAIKERRYNAAVGSGLTADAQKLKSELAELAKQIEARRDLLVSADVYAPEIRALQSFIEDNLKRMEEARLRNDQRMRDLLKELSAGAPELASLPSEQKALAEQLEKRSGELNNARERYAAAMATATAAADEQITTLDAEMTQLQAKMDARKKQIVQAAQISLSAEQQRTRAQTTGRLKAELATAKETESKARAAYVANQQQLTALEAEVAALETMRPRYHELARRVGELRRYQQEQEAGLIDLTKAKERDAALMPIPPGENSVIVTSTPDRRREVMIIAMAIIALVFVGLIVRSHQQADRLGGNARQDSPPDQPPLAADASAADAAPATPAQRRAVAV